MLCALIMAGGKGTRFWPLSTEKKPKQFLTLLDKDTMIQMTVKRIEKIIPRERIFIVTAKQYVSLVKEQLSYIPEKNIIVEPIGKNTAPCIALSAFIIRKYYEDATIAVLPSDHLIKDVDKFLSILSTAEQFVNNNKQSVVTLGMKPNRPETGYGYIKCIGSGREMNGFNVVKVESFVEKPDLKKAEGYLKSGNYLWNGGMFIWKADYILELTKKYIKATYDVLSEIVASKDEDLQSVLDKKYREIESVSVDYAIMEKVNSAYVIPNDFGWDDIGNWRSVERYNTKDKEGNVKSINSMTYKSTSNIVLTKKKTLLNNVKNLIIVETEDYLLISSKDNEQEIKLAKELIS
ncbi:mannose-1-phosphate guanylyltransferase [Clostridium drakei]|uniref:mannose-1-phosphate guanylyltransferase n=1 Tax=Clostridium drakei TaxID=332101 RepID=A0A2U8DUG5_9CLOT|nr:mannose-1-phosphate guanylyltransferase [Clostridium drakei]AWI06393.1 mannose-1-phosphate guanylyltransferase [Clostridium drakei]